MIDFSKRKLVCQIDKRCRVTFDDDAYGDLSLLHYIKDLDNSMGDYNDIPTKFIDEMGLREEFQKYLQKLSDSEKDLKYDW